MYFIFAFVNLDRNNLELEKMSVIWLDADEYHVELPQLFNSSRRRKKDISNVYPHLAAQVYRCKEFPEGVYISEEGEVLPDDPRSGLYKLLPQSTEAPEEDSGEESDVTISVTSDQFDNDWHVNNTRKRRRESVVEDSDYELESSESEQEEEIDEDTESEEELGDLQTNLHEGVVANSKRRRLHSQKLIRCLQDWELTWEALKKQHRSYKIKMIYDAQFVTSQDDPHCTIDFIHPDKTHTHVNMDCDRFCLVCPDGQEFDDMSKLYEYLKPK